MPIGHALQTPMSQEWQLSIYKAVGGWVGDPQWCSDRLVASLRRKLGPLDVVERMRDGEFVRNVETLQRGLLTRVAAAIPSYWFGIMSPSTTASDSSTMTTSNCCRARWWRQNS